MYCIAYSLYIIVWRSGKFVQLNYVDFSPDVHCVRSHTDSKVFNSVLIHLVNLESRV